MKVIKNNFYMTVTIEKHDDFNAVLDMIKSIPKEYREYIRESKEWKVIKTKDFESIFDNYKASTNRLWSEKEIQEGDKALEIFMSQFDDFTL